MMNSKAEIEKTLRNLPSPSPEEMDSARSRILESLNADDGRPVEYSISDFEASKPIRRRGSFFIPAVALVAVAVLVVASIVLTTAKDAPALLESTNHRVAYGEVIRSGASGDIVWLSDATRIEMRSESELQLEEVPDGVRIRLNHGGVIVNAAKQEAGRHLYVQTRDVLVSVVGTVFLVRAEAEGSRVAVIEGEVRVQQGSLDRKLLPGDQVTSDPAMPAHPVQDEIAWSRQAETHLAMLQQAPAPATPPTPTPVSAPVANPDLIGEIRLILAPVDQELTGGPILKNKMIFNALWEQSIDSVLLRQLGLPFANDPAGAPNGFSFSVIGIQGRTISFSNSKNETFSFGCADCSFVVSENGFSKAVSTSEPGVEFKLSADGTALTATCRASECSLLSLTAGVSVLSRGNSAIGGSSQGLSYSNFSRSIFMIPSSQLSQQGGSVIFAVTKPAGQ